MSSNLRNSISASQSRKMNAVYPLVPVLNILAGILVLVPLPWQMKSWNTGICMFAIWNSSMCFVVAVNAIVWRRGTENVAPILCDISMLHFVYFLAFSVILIVLSWPFPDRHSDGYPCLLLDYQ